MDKKIQGAAGDHLPSFQEHDWDRMAVLLDKHLPQEKKKRPFIFGFIVFILTGIPVFLMLTTYKRPPSMLSERTSIASEKLHDSSSTENNQATRSSHTTVESGATNSSSIKTGTEIRLPIPIAAIPSTKISHSRKKNNDGIPQNMPDKTPVINPGSPTSAPAIDTPDNKFADPGRIHKNISGDRRTDINEVLVANPVIEKDSLPAEEIDSTLKDKTTKSNSPSGNWQINFSVGPDLSTVGMHKAGQWKMQYGIGLSYTLSNRWQVRTGFMISRKLYTADSNDYHPPKNFWSYYPNIQKIDANCLVYEIPLNIVYTFPSAQKHRWFVSAGVSSYLMKEENYEYYYKNAWGGLEYRTRNIKNENDHFFSIVQLSGGYQHRLSDKLSLMAEPYFKFPVGGVGFGKVKLNNTGMVFTLGYRPFLKKKK